MNKKQFFGMIFLLVAMIACCAGCVWLTMYSIEKDYGPFWLVSGIGVLAFGAFVLIIAYAFGDSLLKS